MISIDLTPFLPLSEVLLVGPPHFQVWVVPTSDGGVRCVVKDQCAHLGSSLELTSNGFLCRSHNWVYAQNGENKDDSLPGLTQVGFTYSAPVLQLEDSEPRVFFSDTNYELRGDETLTLLAHASFMLTAAESKVLFDPWLVGDAYWGSWRAFPKLATDPSVWANPTHVVITHPHPDHFHPETLSLLDPKTPVYFPLFPSGIIPRLLDDLGFDNIHAVDWDVPVSIADHTEFVFLRPTSYWEDSAVLVKVGNWIWLNQNDAGAPIDSSSLPSPIDLFTASFDVGATGYPLTWGVSARRSRVILEKQAEELVRVLRNLSERISARYFGPFASYWRLNAEPGLENFKEIPHNSIGNLEKEFESVCTEVLRTVPGSELNLKTMEIDYDPSVFDQLEDGDFEPSRVSRDLAQLTNRDLAMRLGRHLRMLAKMSIATQCENVLFALTVKETDIRITQRFGDLSASEASEVDLELPRWAAEQVALGHPQATFHHLDIGYWCKWARRPDKYLPGFMRLIRLGYVPELAFQKAQPYSDLKDVSVADFLERGGDVARAILGRAGLPCSSCKNASSETLLEAVSIHGLHDFDRKYLESSVRAVMGSGSDEGQP